MLRLNISCLLFRIIGLQDRELLLLQNGFNVTHGCFDLHRYEPFHNEPVNNKKSQIIEYDGVSTGPVCNSILFFINPGAACRTDVPGLNVDGF